MREALNKSSQPKPFKYRAHYPLFGAACSAAADAAIAFARGEDIEHVMSAYNQN